MGGDLEPQHFGFTPSSVFKTTTIRFRSEIMVTFPEESVPFGVDWLFWSSFVNLSVPSSLLVSLTLLHGVHSLLF